MFVQRPLSFEYYAQDIRAGVIPNTEDLLQRVDAGLLAEELKLCFRNFGHQICGKRGKKVGADNGNRMVKVVPSSCVEWAEMLPPNSSTVSFAI